MFIAVRRSRVRNGIERGRVKSDHGDQHQDEYDRRQRHCVDNIQDQLIQISVCLILRDKICCLCRLKPKGMIAENDKAYNCGANAKNIPAKDRLTDRSPLGNVSDKERCGDALDHPVYPVINRPVLRKIIRTHWIRIR